MSKTIKSTKVAKVAKVAKTIKTNAPAMFVAPATIASPMPVTVPAFPGKQFLAAQTEHVRAMERAHGKFTDKVKTLFNAWLDAAARAGVPRDEAGCKALRKAFIENEVVVRGIEEGVWLRSTITNYAQGAMRAYFHGTEWTPRAFQSEENGGVPALPWSTQPKASKASEAKDAKDAKVAKASEAAAPADEAEARAFIVAQLSMIDAYGKKHLKVLDLRTRDMLDQLRKIRDNIAKIGAAD